jgi:hypothetical protein
MTLNHVAPTASPRWPPCPGDWWLCWQTAPTRLHFTRKDGVCPNQARGLLAWELHLPEDEQGVSRNVFPEFPGISLTPPG